MLTLGLSYHPCGMLSRGSAALLLIQLSPVLSVWTSVVIDSFPFEQGYDEDLLAPSEVAKLFLMPFREILIFYGAQSMFALCVYVDSLGAVSSLAAHKHCGLQLHCTALLLYTEAPQSHLPFPGTTLGDCFSPCLLARLSLMRPIRL